MDECETENEKEMKKHVVSGSMPMYVSVYVRAECECHVCLPSG